jgi:DNA-binding CsgD family transcriptional regulator
MHEMDSWWGMAEALEGCAALAAARGRSDLALCWAGAASALRAPSAYAVHPFEQARLGHWLDRSRQTLGDIAADAAWSAGVGADRHEVAAAAMAFLAEPVPTPATVASGASSGSTARHGLSKRELEVLHLIAAGRTDQQIADALFISPRTAEWHVRNVLRTLGVTNRAEAVAYAARLGLI